MQDIARLKRALEGEAHGADELQELQTAGVALGVVPEPYVDVASVAEQQKDKLAALNGALEQGL